ncbi:unnamed protein product [Microthlaspi erraticum]|uniref:Uncharacterized protein n=1 Tax=Microthlaspi erraticum TaxID=1685480 RepID=A0A6D2KJI2_9BRAS|nr:unnamed protein product [Microthlaspi erraticum]
MTTKESYPRKGMIQDYLHLKNREGLELETVEWNLRLSQVRKELEEQGWHYKCFSSNCIVIPIFKTDTFVEIVKEITCIFSHQTSVDGIFILISHNKFSFTHF